MHYLFASQSLGPQARLLGEIAEVIGDRGQLEAFRDVEDFVERLRRHNGPDILILLAADRGDLTRLIADRAALIEADVILLVPDQAADTVARAHTLRPCYLGTTDCDLDKVVPVLKRLLEKRARRFETTREPGR